jgi:hypothetical protein
LPLGAKLNNEWAAVAFRSYKLWPIVSVRLYLKININFTIGLKFIPCTMNPYHVQKTDLLLFLKLWFYILLLFFSKYLK